MPAKTTTYYTKPPRRTKRPTAGRVAQRRHGYAEQAALYCHRKNAKKTAPSYHRNSQKPSTPAMMPEDDYPPSKSELRQREKKRKRDQRFGQFVTHTPPGAFEKRLAAIFKPICHFIGACIAVAIFTAIGAVFFGGMGAFIGFLIGVACGIAAWREMD